MTTLSTHRLSRPILTLFSTTIASLVKFEITLLLSVTQKNKIDRLISFFVFLSKTVIGYYKKLYFNKTFQNAS